MFDSVADFLQIGLGMIAGIMFGSLLLVIVSTWLSSKIVGSLHDGFYSAIKAVAYSILVGIGISFLASMLQFAAMQWEFLNTIIIIIIFILGLVGFLINFMIIKNIYDISYLKALLLIILSMVMHMVIGAILVFILGASFFAQFSNSISVNEINSEASVSDEIDSANENLEIVNTEQPEDAADSVEKFIEDEVSKNPLESKKSNGPKIPKIPSVDL